MHAEHFFSLNYITALEQPDLCVGATEEIWNGILGYRKLVQVNKWTAVFDCAGKDGAQPGRGASAKGTRQGEPVALVTLGVQLMQRGRVLLVPWPRLRGQG